MTDSSCQLSSIPPRVSVVMATYNHAGFIAEALESALDQVTSFPIEIIVGDDASSDGTREIVDTYAKGHPGRVRPVLRPQNIGGRANLMDLLASAGGEYIAFLEGDDRWTAQDKLQRQVDVLDAHPECAGCCHGTRAVFEDGSGRSPSIMPAPAGTRLELEDLLERNPVATCSVMLRRRVIQSLPDWYTAVPMGDWPLLILAACQGPLYYIDRIMGQYRVHPGGVWTQRSRKSRALADIELLRVVDAHFGGAHSGAVARQIARRHLVLARLSIEAGHFGEARRSVVRAVIERRRARVAVLDERDELKVLVEAFFPRSYRVLRCLKRRLFHRS